MSWKIENFTIDENLLYIVQQVSGDRTEDILLYLYEASTAVIVDFETKSKGLNLKRTNKFFYKKNTKLPITLDIYSYNFRSKDKNGKVHVTVKFPSSKRTLDPDQLAALYNQNIEKSIGLVDEVTRLVNFNQPITKLNKGLRKVL